MDLIIFNLKVCEESDITIYLFKYHNHKLGIIHRLHSTIKEKLAKYFDVNDTVKWIAIIDKIVYNYDYNYTVNRGIGYKPIDVNDYIENVIRQTRKEEGFKV